MIQWYVIRAAGAMTLILFTAAVVLGLVDRSRWSTRRWPRFLIDRVHRNVALLAVAFLCVHVVAAVTDDFVTIPVLSAVIPFSSSYRPFWVGLGAVAFDLLLAVTVTSLARSHIGHRGWRAVHLLGYLAWPVAVLHGLGIGTDTTTPWMLAIDACCIACVLGALTLRWLSAPRTLDPDLADGWR